MAMGFSTSLRNARATEIVTAAGANAKILFYDGTRPATGGTATTLLAELTGGGTQFGTVAAGVLTLDAVTQDASSNAAGDATWARVTTSADVFVSDFSVTATGGGGDIEINNITIALGVPVSITSGTITEANA